jgi:hypothetical protein
MMAKKPEDRFQTAQQVVDRLSEGSGSNVSSRSASVQAPRQPLQQVLRSFVAKVFGRGAR